MATERSSSRRRVDFLTLLPDSLLQKILLPLPVESLVSLASTCNKWRDYLTNDDFARLHLDQWRSRYGILYNDVLNLVYSPIFDGKANKIILAGLEDCFSRSLKEGDDFRVLNSCDGLLLIECGRLVVCNPLMRSYKSLQLPPGPVSTCHCNIVYDASIKRYKIIAIRNGQVVCDDGVLTYWGRQVYILELCKSSSESESEWKEVCDDGFGGWDLGGRVQKSLLVDEKGNKKKKLYCLTYNDGRAKGDEVRTSLIDIDIETHQVKAVVAAGCSSMSTLGSSFWVGSSSTGRFYMSDYVNVSEEFNLFVLEDVHSPIWKRRCINRRNVVDIRRSVIQPVAILQDNGNDEKEKILYEIKLLNGHKKIYEYHTVGGLWREVSNYTQHDFRDVRYLNYYHGNFCFSHLHSLIRI